MPVSGFRHTLREATYQPSTATLSQRRAFLLSVIFLTAIFLLLHELSAVFSLYFSEAFY